MDIQALNKITIPTLKSKDSVSFALELMHDERLFVLPVLDEDGIYLGIADYDRLLSLKKTSKLNQVELIQQTTLTSVNSVYDAIRLFRTGQELVVLLDDHGYFENVLTPKSIVEHFAQLGAVESPGGYLTLRVEQNNYSLSEIARIAESNNALVLSLLLSSTTDVGYLDITLKFNLEDLTYLIATFERFSYQVTGYHHQSNVGDLYNERYLSLMRYLST
jgi:CBS domain-containing protein